MGLLSFLATRNTRELQLRSIMRAPVRWELTSLWCKITNIILQTDEIHLAKYNELPDSYH